MTKAYTARITGAPDALSDWYLSVLALNIDLTATTGGIELRSRKEQDYTEALLRPNGKLEVFESIDEETPVELVSVDMFSASGQDLKKTASNGKALTEVTVRGGGPVAAWSTVTDVDVSSILLSCRLGGSSRTWRLPYLRQLTPGSTAIRGADQRITVERCSINVTTSAQMYITMSHGDS
jgi:hypothetical protein